VNTQINRLSMPDLPAILETLIREGAEAWQVMLTVAMGRAADEPDVLLQPYDLLALFPVVDALVGRCREAGVTFYPGNNLGYFGPYESRIRGTLPRGHGVSCGAGKTTLGIESDGLVKGCPSLPSAAWGGGTIREHALVEIWERAQALRYTRDRTVEDLTGYCRTCYYADTCRAGCTWTGSVLFGKPGDNPYCHHRALERDRAGLRERLVLREAAPGEPFDNAVFELIVEPVPQRESP
jgi:radical SAM protein with 4Fe4S-binding SPASM domain